MLEDKLTVEHVKNVLKQAQTKLAAKPGILGFNETYNDMGAGLTFNLQLALAQLGSKFDRGIDGIYGSKDTRLRVQEFQNAWNAAHTDDILDADGWAGEKTIAKMIVALDDTGWDKTKVEHQ